MKIMFGIKFNFLSTPVSFSIPGSLSRFLGRSWSICSTPLSRLIQKIVQVVKTRFSRSAPKPATPIPLIPPENKSEPQMIEPAKAQAIKCKPDDGATSPKSESNQDRGPEPPQIESKPVENSNHPSVEQSASVAVTPSLFYRSPPSSQSASEAFTSTATSNSEARKKRREERRKNRSTDPEQSGSAQLDSNVASLQSGSSSPNSIVTPLQSCSVPLANPPSVQHQTIPTSTSVQNNSLGAIIAQLFGLKSNDTYEIIECGGGGDCQLHSLYKGLKLKYPNLLTEHKITSDLDLRRMGVEFAKKQIDSCGPYHLMVLGYLDSDRKEANEDPKESVKIENDEDFLKKLSAKGFSCSSTHLYALSHLLKIPIEVHDASDKIQVFNPTQSVQEPILLYHKNKNHYQLKVLR